MMARRPDGTPYAATNRGALNWKRLFVCCCCGVLTRCARLPGWRRWPHPRRSTRWPSPTHHTLRWCRPAGRLWRSASAGALRRSSSIGTGEGVHTEARCCCRHEALLSPVLQNSPSAAATPGASAPHLDDNKRCHGYQGEDVAGHGGPSARRGQDLPQTHVAVLVLRAEGRHAAG